MRTSSSLRMSATPHTVSIASTCHITQLGRLIITLCDYYTSKISSQRKRRYSCPIVASCSRYALYTEVSHTHNTRTYTLEKGVGNTTS
jgi:hypothetical protein